MAEFWTANGFYLWLLTTGLAVIALAWLAWNAFTDQADETEKEPSAASEELQAIQAQLAEMAEGRPLMQATLGRSLQYFGLEHFTDPAGAQGFSLAVVNARGDGFLLSSSVRGGLSVKPLAVWGARAPLTPSEEGAIQRALEQRGLIA